MATSSELILNGDGTVYHLHVNGEMISDNIILVGDPHRAEVISGFFDKVLFHAENREYKTYTGLYKGRPVTVMSTGIGVGNIDIVINELHIAANYNLETGERNQSFRHLRLIRLGTCGTVQSDIHIGDSVVSEYSIGTDALAFYYKDSDKVRDLDLESCFMRDMNWVEGMPPVYAVRNSSDIVALFDGFARKGITLSAVGFYGPQGRNVALAPWDGKLIESAGDFRYRNLMVNNFEMEGAPVAFLASMLGHSAATVCLVIAERVAGNGNPDYSENIRALIEYTLEKITK